VGAPSRKVELMLAIPEGPYETVLFDPKTGAYRENLRTQLKG